jgi:hypothetical protein
MYLCYGDDLFLMMDGKKEYFMLLSDTHYDKIDGGGDAYVCLVSCKTGW